MPVARRVQRHGAADAEVRPEQRPGEPDGDRAVDPDDELDVMRYARQRGVHDGCRSRRAAEARARASVGTMLWPELMGDGEAGAIAAALGQGLTAGRENDAMRL